MKTDGQNSIQMEDQFNTQKLHTKHPFGETGTYLKYARDRTCKATEKVRVHRLTKMEKAKVLQTTSLPIIGVAKDIQKDK